MTARVEWLPVGHITHGYRRVFTVYENEKLRHVVNIAPMPYEQVYRVREISGQDEVVDPALWWGLSVIARLISEGTLLGRENPDTADDGYVHVRPQPIAESDLIPLSTFQAILQEGTFTFPH